MKRYFYVLDGAGVVVTVEDDEDPDEALSDFFKYSPYSKVSISFMPNELNLVDVQEVPIELGLGGDAP